MSNAERKRPTYQRLSADEVGSALPPGWTGDTDRLTRSVTIADPDALLERVAAIEAELDHHAKADRDGDAVMFTVWTHSKGGVTDADIELAERISEAIDAG